MWLRDGAVPRTCKALGSISSQGEDGDNSWGVGPRGISPLIPALREERAMVLWVFSKVGGVGRLSVFLSPVVVSGLLSPRKEASENVGLELGRPGREPMLLILMSGTPSFQ